MAGLFALVIAPGLFGQTTPAPAERQGETISLSPFTISTDRDNGFVAASSLAGGRLANDLRDTPVAYSVITRDFIDALQITNAFEAASWSPNTVISVASNGGGYGDDVSGSPGSYSVRGAGGGRGQRNFFIYNSPNDSYAVERFDFSRGPNAILFGNGSLGGVASTMTKQARFDSAFTQLTQGVGSWSNFRTTLDVNRPLGERVAVRTALVDAHSEGWRDKQFDKIRAAFVTVSWKVARHTTLRVEGEYGEARRNQTFSNLADQLSGWDGRTVFSGRADTLPANANALGVTRRGSGYLVYDPFSGVNAIMNYQNDPTTLAGGANNQVPLAGFVQGALPSFASSGANILYSLNLPAQRFANAIAGSAFRLPARSFSLASDAPVIHERFKDVQVTLDHRIGPVFLQVAADLNRNRQNVYNIDVRGSNTMYIDINRVLPNGAPNPHFLQPYADGTIRRNVTPRQAESLRFAAGYVKDTARWGNYSFNVMGGHTETKNGNSSLNLSVAQNADHRRWGSTGSSLGATDIVRIRRYWNEDSRPYLAPASVRYIDPLSGADKTISPIWSIENDRSDSQQLAMTRYRYAIAAFNAKYFSNRLIFLGAVRVDSFYNQVRQQIAAGDYDAATWSGLTYLFKPDAPADWADLTFTPKAANGTATGPTIAADTRPRDGNGNPQPQYARDRFKDDYNAPAIDKRQVTRSVGLVYHLTRWVTPYANYAETFNPPGAIQRIDSSFLPPTVAKGTDLGLRFTLLGGRITLSAARYTNEEQNNGFDPGVQGNINGILAANAVGDQTPSGRNIRGLGNVPAVMRDLRDRRATGYELEAIANLTKQWRLLLNLGLPKVYEERAYRDTKAYLTANDATLRQIMADTGALIDASGNATVNNTIPINDRSPDVNGAVNSWNSLTALRRTLIDGRRLTQDQTSLNIFTDYTLGVTRLKGLRLGGGVQYRGKQIIGNRGADTIVNPANPLAAIDDPAVDAYTPVYAPASYYTVVATLGYSLRLAKRREVRFDLRINNVLNDQGPIYSVSTALRPKGGDLTSPARETVANVYAYKQPLSLNLTSSLRF
jgi:outer membrane receptor protein involved in Fe transport